MDTPTIDIRPGMDVIGKDGRKIGSVAGVHRESSGSAPRRGETDVTESGLRVQAEVGSITGAPTETATTLATEASHPTEDPTRVRGGWGSGYLEVEEDGLASLGADRLYVPYAAVLSVVSGQSVLVDCHRDECLERFGEKPGWLDT